MSLEEAEKAIPAVVRMFSGCEDKQTSKAFSGALRMLFELSAHHLSHSVALSVSLTYSLTFLKVLMVRLKLIPYLLKQEIYHLSMCNSITNLNFLQSPMLVVFAFRTQQDVLEEP